MDTSAALTAVEFDKNGSSISRVYVSFSDNVAYFDIQSFLMFAEYVADASAANNFYNAIQQTSLRELNALLKDN